MIPPATRAANELQATACLEAAEKHRDNLLAVAVRLAASQEGGMDLFQQTCLNCHDAIQRNGFAGGRYEFYLLASIKNLHYKNRKQPRPVPLVPELDRAELPDLLRDEQAELAEQMMQEVRHKFSPPERLTLRLHIDGYSCRQISDMTKVHYAAVWRQLSRMKNHLRETFRQAWEALGE